MKKIYLLFLLGMVNFLGAQNNSNQDKLFTPEVYPKTPESTAIIKNISLPPGSYTGTYGYKVDLGAITLKNLNLPISLDYSTTGIRVNSISGKVGTGWVLNVGNISLNRDVRGYVDNLLEEPTLTSYSNFFPNEDDPFTSGANGDYTIATKITGVNQINNESKMDANKDYFIYSLINNSGRFIQDMNGSFHTIPKDDVKISNDHTLVDNQGNTYYFGNYRNYITNGASGGASDNVFYGNRRLYVGYAYRIDSIKLPSNEIIKFSYVKDDYKYTSSYDKSLDLKTNETDYSPFAPCEDNSTTPTISRNHQEVTDYTIKEINYPNGKIVFDYVENNQEVEGGKVLKSVKFYQNNQLYKDFELESSFTTSEIPAQIITRYNENFSKRLFLFKVTEKKAAIDYLFNYYGVNQNSLQTDFPSRFSGKEDYWGNFSLAGNFLPSSNYYINNVGLRTKYNGANKNPNLNEAIIGSLQSIQLPTGGFQKITYDLDDFYDEAAKEYYEDTKRDGTYASHSETVASVTKTITINEPKTIIKADIRFYYDGINDVDYDEHSQSLPTVSYYYVDISVNDTHWKRVINDSTYSFLANEMLKNGDVIKFKFTYKAGRVKPVKNLDSGASVDLSYTTFEERNLPGFNKKSGNLRVKELLLKENENAETYKKQYAYTKFDQPTLSSGFFLGRDMTSDYYSRKPNSNPAIERSLQGGTCTYLNVSSQNNFNLYATESKSVVYPNVTEKIINVKDQSFYLIEKEFTVPNRIYYNEFQLPLIQGPYTGFMGGLLLKEKYKDDKGNTLKEISNNYNYDNYFNQFSSKYSSENFENIYPAMNLSATSFRIVQSFGDEQTIYNFDVNIYGYPSTWIKLMETKEVDYQNNKFIEKIKSYSYNYSQLKPIKELVSNSKGEVLETTYQYPPDLTTNATAIALTAQNRISEPISIKQKVDSVTVSEVYNQYADFNGLLQKSAVFQKKGEGIVTTQTTDRKIVYNSYDSKGNITQYTVENGLPVAIIWGYNEQYPIAKIEGTTYSTVSSFVTALQTASDEGSLTKDSFNGLRTALPNAMITTYVYKPLVGVTSITGPNGLSEYYKYDGAGRLEEIKNDKQEVLKTFQYNYKN